MLKRSIFRLVSVLLSAALLAVLAGCDTNETPSTTATSGADFPVTVGGVTIQAAPERMVCLSPSIGEVLEALGSTAALVGVGSGVYADSSLPRVGTSVLPDVDAIIALSPDLVLTSTAPPADTAQSLSLQGIPVAVIPAAQRYDQLEEYYTQIASLVSGQETGTANASATVSRIKEKIDAIATKAAAEPAVRTCLLLSSETAATSDSLLGDILTLAGGENAAGSATGYVFSLDDLAAAAPDVIICPSTLVSTISSGNIYAGIPAVENGRVYAMESSSLESWGEGLVTVAGAIAQVLHPSLFTEEESNAVAPAEASE